MTAFRQALSRATYKAAHQLCRLHRDHMAAYSNGVSGLPYAPRSAAANVFLGRVNARPAPTLADRLAQHKVFKELFPDQPCGHYRPRDVQTVTYNDGTYCVIVGRQQVVIGKQDTAVIEIPRGHAWFDRVAEATTRREVEDLYNELAQALA